VTLEHNKGAFTLPRVRDEAVTLVRTLIRLAETAPAPPPEDRLINLQLFYYDDRTPPGYQPPGFEDTTHAEYPSFASSAVQCSVGKIASKHHAMQLKVAYACDEGKDLQGMGFQEEGVGAGAGAAPPSPTAPLTGKAAAGQAGKSAAPSAPPPAGVDAAALTLCRTALAHVATGSAVSLKTIVDVAQVSGESARRLLALLEAEGLLKRLGPVSSTRYTVQAVPAEAAAAPSAKGADADADASRRQATTWFTRAVTAALALALTRPFVSLADLAAEAGEAGKPVDVHVAQCLAKKLVELGILAAPGADGAHVNKGRRVIVGPTTHQQLRDAIGQLRELGEPVPAYALAALSAPALKVAAALPPPPPPASSNKRPAETAQLAEPATAKAARTSVVTASPPAALANAVEDAWAAVLQEEKAAPSVKAAAGPPRATGQVVTRGVSRLQATVAGGVNNKGAVPSRTGRLTAGPEGSEWV